jgi:hypothetical protein
MRSGRCANALALRHCATLIRHCTQAALNLVLTEQKTPADGTSCSAGNETRKLIQELKIDLRS